MINTLRSITNELWLTAILIDVKKRKKKVRQSGKLNPELFVSEYSALASRLHRTQAAP